VFPPLQRGSTWIPKRRNWRQVKAFPGPPPVMLPQSSIPCLACWWGYPWVSAWKVMPLAGSVFPPVIALSTRDLPMVSTPPASSTQLSACQAPSGSSVSITRRICGSAARLRISMWSITPPEARRGARHCPPSARRIRRPQTVIGGGRDSSRHGIFHGCARSFRVI